MHLSLSTVVFTLATFSGLAFAAPGEQIPAGEAEAISKIAGMIKAQVAAAAKATGTAERDAHPKAHGCVHGTLEVNQKVRADLRTGVFQDGAKYPVWIRYSNGTQKDDTAGDARGMAIKLMDVPGEKLSETEKFTQDFLLINHPVFIVKNAVDYVEFSKASGSGDLLKFFLPSAKPWTWRTREMKNAFQIQRKKVADLIQTQYWSMTPYLMGSTPAKFSVKPCHVGTKRKWNTSSKNFLGENLQTRLSEGSACFEFLVQLQTNAKKMPVEDPTVKWKERYSKFVKVATLTIPQQTFDSEAQQHFCENLSFNPWHSVSEHQPLGGINRVRRVVYQTISELRHGLNHEPLLEPTGNEVFSE